ncbi:hypothetical protein LCGC14_1992910 [marine sediment metagenome]|uniref:Uncharacterized protein n=2 Tax=marine sediment metagenome TaxID=412755 RepID=A0A0F9HIW3_9ZZZZ
MRDPKRIREFLDVVAYTWERVPNYRFGQLVMNLAGYWGAEDIYNIEEPEWISIMHSFRSQFDD